MFYQRYDGASLAATGLLIGAATILGGIGGTYIGTKLCEHYDGKIKNAYFLIPSIFSFLGGVLFLFIININNLAIGFICIFLFEIFAFGVISPITTLAINLIPPKLRSRSAGVTIFIQHILGLLIAPVLIGAISDSTGSLKTGMQTTWIAIFISGGWWLCGYIFVPPIPPIVKRFDLESKEDSNSTVVNKQGPVYDGNGELVEPLTYKYALFGCCCTCASQNKQ